MAEEAIPAVMPIAPHAFTVSDAMVLCGINNVTLFDGLNAAQRIAADVFDDDFNTCLDKSFKELDADFKTYSELTVGQGR